MKKILLAVVVLYFAAASSCKKTSPVVQPTTDSLKVGLIAYYQFNNSGVDSSGRKNDVSYYANVTATTDRFGKANSAFSFNGTSSYLVVPDKPELRLNNTDFSLNAWVNLKEYRPSFGNNVLSKHVTGNDNGWAWGVAGLGSITTVGIVTFGPGGSSVTERGTKAVGLNQWHMITSTYKVLTKEFTIYIDGELDIVIKNNFPSPNPDINANLYIGRDDPSASFDGYFVNGSLDDIRIYNRLLTPAQVKTLFTHKN
ncbi:LamG domain-containing protein [Mucilaginibacter calamicampi]|uniref:LamG domain-containing protein n=1 Tax=Mucilaginibacter calamicampi TaxID=1302352 RepID=A0ABW2Z189_9SPHI